MKLTLSENIRSFRKQRKLTQEQLAEVLGVTTGAIYKWEAKLSIPELELLLKMADFFDVSLDVLLGYQVRDNSREAIENRLDELSKNGDPAALEEAEMALKKYPNSFAIVCYCAWIYDAYGSERHDRALLQRSLALYERALLLIAQNPWPSVSESTIYGNIGWVYLSMGEAEKGVEMLKKHNAGGMFTSSIGFAQAMLLRRFEEADRSLSNALLSDVTDLMQTVVGFAFLFSTRHDYASELEIVAWGQKLMLGLRTSEEVNYLDKTNASLLTLLAHAQLRTGKPEEARASLGQAAALVRQFDAAPDYGIGSIRFVNHTSGWNYHDMLGATAKDSVEYLIQQLADAELASLWEQESEE
jgi:transcriptional regulator with XRE-family HTH domain